MMKVGVSGVTQVSDLRFCQSRPEACVTAVNEES